LSRLSSSALVMGGRNEYTPATIMTAPTTVAAFGTRFIVSVSRTLENIIKVWYDGDCLFVSEVELPTPQP
jgi:hypothetical protein